MNNDVTAGDKCCLDTNILIDVSRKKASAVGFLENLEEENEVCCSIVSNFEMLSGARNKREQKTITDFFSNAFLTGKHLEAVQLSEEEISKDESGKRSNWKEVSRSCKSCYNCLLQNFSRFQEDRLT